MKRLLLVVVLLLAGVVLTLLAISRWSRYYSSIIDEDVDRAEQLAKADLTAWANEHPNPRNEFHAEVFFSKEAVNALLREVTKLPPVPLGTANGPRLKIRESKVDFNGGFPRIDVEAEILEARRGLNVAAEGVAVLQVLPFNSDHPPTLRVRLIRLTPKLRPKLLDFAVRNLLRDTAQAIAQMHVDQWPEILLPVSNDINFDLPAKKFPIHIPTRPPENWIDVTVSLPQVHRRETLQIQQLLFLKDGIHMFATLGNSPPQAAAETSATTSPNDWTQKLIGNHTGSTCEVRIARFAFSSALQHSVTELLKTEHTITVQGTGQKGHFKETTGGFPFGNGYYLELDDPTKANGTAEVSNVTIKPADASCWDIAGKVSIGGNAQIHGHGKPPHVDIKVFGKKVTGGFGVGGGAGNTAKTQIDHLDVTGVFRACAQSSSPKPPELVLSLLSPSEVKVHANVKLEIVGWVPVPVELSMKLPTGVLYNLTFPSIIAANSRIAWQGNSLTLAVKIPSYTITSDATSTIVTGLIEFHVASQAPTESSPTNTRTNGKGDPLRIALLTRN